MAGNASPTPEEPQGPYFLPHPAYAEDQPYAHSILTVHVLYRAFQAGSVVGGIAGATRHVFQRSSLKPAFSTALLRGAGRGGLIATALLAVGLPLRMRGKAEIEWQDRAWRLMENKGQVSTDRWSGAGALAGGVYAVGMGLLPLPLAALGAVGVGSFAGCLGSMGYRYQLAVDKSGR